ncbi:Protein transport protein Sec24-like [Acorus gramineus]|uniref:Protein transport protein Sec24-like n=1 Tax=Acorus gramineus TaxID=55184 RepID=A0AAV9BWC7_ACOGR|nr:Protein transport protein Sec24-like [Acorus gramineus]
MASTRPIRPPPYYQNQPPPPPPPAQPSPGSLAQNLHNLQIHRPPSPYVPDPSANRPPPPSYLPPGVPPPPSAFPRPSPPQSRPSAPPPSQSPFASRPPPPSMMPSGPPQPPMMGSGTPQPPMMGSSSPQLSFMARGPPQPAIQQGPTSNGPPPAAIDGAPRFPPTMARAASPSMIPSMAQPVRPFPGSPPMGPQAGQPPPPMGPPFGSSQAYPAQPMAASTPPPPSFGAPPPWQMQQRPVGPGMQAPPRMYGMPPSMLHGVAPNQPPVPPVHQMMGHTPIPGSLASVPSKIDPDQIPRPMQSALPAEFETRVGNQANTPPPATSEYIVRDTGNCSPRYMRCTLSQIPCSSDLLTTSGMPLVLMVQPLAIPHPNDDPIQIVDFGESGPVRCSRCKGYINPFMKFIDQGKRFICNLCGFTGETPRDYHCNLGPDGRRRDADERPELCRGTVEFVATKEYMVRDPMPAVFFFLIDVSMNAVQTGATAAACSAVSQAIADLPEGPQTMVGVATFDSTIHFYNLKRAQQQPLMLIVPDINDVYTPLHTDLVVQLAECRQHLEQLLDSIPSVFQSNKVADSALGAAIKASFLAIKPTGGKLLVFQSVLPSVGIGALSAREAEGRTNISASEKEAHKLLKPADKTLTTMAMEFAEHQVCVDIFITAQTYVDIASMSVVPRITGGQVYYYHPFSAVSDSAKLYNDLRWNVSRPQGFEAVMRVRCSQGLQVQEYSGNFCKRIPTDVDLPAIDCDKTIMVSFKHDDKFQEGSECAFQCALLYTTVSGQRRIRVTTLSLPCTSNLSNLFRAADLDTQFACFLKQAANEIPTTHLDLIRDQVMNLCVNILHAYRKFCATVSSPGQLILPEALKLLPLYTLALIKSVGLRTDGRLDDRSYWVSRAACLSIPLTIPFVYPRMLAVHDLISKVEDGALVPPPIPLSSEHVTDDGIFFLENGEDSLIYVGNSVDSNIVIQLFGVPSVDGLPTQFVVEQFDNELSRKFNDVVNEVRRQRCSYLRLRLCRKGDPSGMLFLSYLVEDKAPTGLSYVEFLVYVHRQIQNKTTV